MEPFDERSPILEIKEDSELEQSEASKTKFDWCIRFKRHGDDELQMMNVLESPVFQAKRDSNTKWKLKLYPNGCDNEYNGYASLFLYLVSSRIPEMQAFLKLSIWNGNDAKELTRFAIFHANTSNHSESIATAGFSKFVKSSFFEEYHHNVHRRCVVKCYIQAFPRQDEVPRSMRVSTDNHLIKDLECLLNDKKLADVTLVSSSGKKFKAHKAILSSRSPVFDKMFEHEMREKRENVVKISDLEDIVLENVLQYVYTGRTKNVKTHAAKLMAAADKYQLDGLKSICADELLRGISVDNAVNILVLADLYNMAGFKLKVIDFVNEHAKRVVDTPAFKALGKKQAYLIMEAYSLLAAAFRKEHKHCGTKKRRTTIRRRRRRVILKQTRPRAIPKQLGRIFI